MREPRSLVPADPASPVAALSEEAVRTVVRRIVDATLAGGANTLTWLATEIELM